MMRTAAAESDRTGAAGRVGGGAERRGSLLPDDILNLVLRLYADEKRPASEVLRYI